MKKINKREIGNLGEDKAVKFLEDKSYQILERNYYSRYGEIDIIARDNESIVFIEVKYRKNNNFGLGMESISLKKIKSMCKTARNYLMSDEIAARFDVISIDNNSIEHIVNAFEYQL